MPRKVRILLTNDDGIDAPGIKALYRELTQIGDVTVVAPLIEMSAVGHAITLSNPLRVRHIDKSDGAGITGYAVDGTPADCVKIAYWALLKTAPEIVVSGINLGGNTGINTIYSGTVSAATEGAILDLPAFAISLATYRNPDFSYAAKFARELIPVVMRNRLPRGVFLNVNVPPVPGDKIKGVSVTRQGRALFEEKFDKRVDPHGNTYYWLTGQKVNVETSTDADDAAINESMVSITPVHYDLTHYDSLDFIRSWKIEK